MIIIQLLFDYFVANYLYFKDYSIIMKNKGSISTNTMKIKIDAYDVIRKTVSKGTNTSGRVYLPKQWIGKQVKVFLIEEAETDEELKNYDRK